MAIIREIHSEKGWIVRVHDDDLLTGAQAEAATKRVQAICRKAVRKQLEQARAAQQSPAPAQG